jgi:hypothetical protein
MMQRDRYKGDPQRYLNYTRKWRRANRDKVREIAQAWRDRNQEKVREYARQYRWRQKYH